MNNRFDELILGGVLVAPFVAYAAIAAVLLALAVPVLSRLGFERMFGNPPLMLIGLYTMILAFLMVLL